MTGLAKRVLTAVIGLPLLLVILYYGGIWFFLLVLGVGLIALYEYRMLWCHQGMNCVDPVFYLAGALMISMAWLGLETHAIVLIFLAVVINLGYHGLKDTWGKKGNLASVGIMAMGLIYVAWPLSLILLLRYQSIDAVLFLLVLAFGSDTAAYFVGINFGRHRLAPSISPKKSMEGAVGALFATGLLGMVWTLMVNWNLSPLGGFVLGFSASAVGQVGDLLESMMKRFCGVKDSGSLLPGHGGILDRIDSLLLLIPFLYFVLQLVG